MLRWIEELELPLLLRIVCDWESPLADGVAPFLNATVFGIFFFALLFLLVATTRGGRSRLPRALLTTLLALGLARGTLFVLWKTLPRARPGDRFTEEQTLRGPLERPTCAEHPTMWVERAHPPGSPSFPSAHAITAGAAAAGLWTASRLLGALGWLFALLVGLGRLYWGKHWPSDILGSFAIAAAAAWIGWRIAPRILDRFARWRVGRPPAPR